EGGVFDSLYGIPGTFKFFILGCGILGIILRCETCSSLVISSIVCIGPTGTPTSVNILIRCSLSYFLIRSAIFLIKLFLFSTLNAFVWYFELSNISFHSNLSQILKNNLLFAAAIITSRSLVLKA